MKNFLIGFFITLFSIFIIIGGVIFISNFSDKHPLFFARMFGFILLFSLCCMGGKSYQFIIEERDDIRKLNGL
jgi:hypothetical protein